jgi:hypothetical protein
MGANQGVQNLVDAGALAVGLAIYSVPWRRLRRNVRRPSPDGTGRLERSTEPGLPGLDSTPARPVAPGSHK